MLSDTCFSTQCDLAMLWGKSKAARNDTSLVGQLKFLNVCSRCKRVQREETRFSSTLETRPPSWSLAKPFRILCLFSIQHL